MPVPSPETRRAERQCPCLRRQSTCRVHGGRSICPHTRLRRLCPPCAGSGICAHQRRRDICIECSPLGNLWARVRSATRRGLSAAVEGRRSRTHEVVGCSREHARSFIDAKMQAWNETHAEKMTLANVHIDHIKPLSSVRLEANGAAALAQVCHYTNLQPLLLLDNERKAARWSAHDDAEWARRIAGCPETTGIYWPRACGPLNDAGLGWEDLHLLADAALLLLQSGSRRACI